MVVGCDCLIHFPKFYGFHYADEYLIKEVVMSMVLCGFRFYFVKIESVGVDVQEEEQCK